MTFRTSAGTKLYVSAIAPGAFTGVGFAALDWALVGLVENLGSFGAQFDLVTFTPLAERVVQKKKGSVNYGQISPSIAIDDEDDGQAICEPGAESDNDYYFKIELQSGTVYYITGQIMQWMINIGATNDVTKVTMPIEITRKPVKVAAA